jgi:HEPN domain-containing protein
VDKAKHIEFWCDSADEDWAAAQSLLEKRHHRHALFFVHLAVEKRIKAAVVAATGEIPPKSHDLLRLAALAGLPLDDEKRAALSRIARYWLEGRYPDTWGGPPEAEEARAVAVAAESVSAWLQAMFGRK